ncbi:hypothetical protein N9R34_01555 [Candidatus Thioglobus sp.]|nr:hypothetical protein [Candidatus Thioglobus sp.]
MKKLLALLLLFLIPTISYSNFYDGIWKVTDVVGESWFSLNKRHIGKTQEFYKGYAGGVFFTCNYKGLVTSSDSYALNEFLNKTEFKLFKKHKTELGFEEEGEVAVTKQACTGNFFNKEMYPIVTFTDWNKAYHLKNSAIFVMEL